MLLAWKKHVRTLFSSVDMALCKEVARTYKNFPTYSMPHSFVNMLAGQLPVLLLTPVFGGYEVGLWSMALLLGFTPICMINRAMYQSLYRLVAVRVNNREHIGSIFRRFSTVTFLVTVPTFAVLFIFLPQLTQWLLGAEWGTSGHYIRWILPWLCINLLNASIGFLADIFFKQCIGLAFELLSALLRTIGVVVGVLTNSFVVAVASYSIGSAVAAFAQYNWLMSLFRHYDSTLESSVQDA